MKNVHPVYGVRIWTHNLWNISILPLPLDQGSRPFLSQLYLVLFSVESLNHSLKNNFVTIGFFDYMRNEKDFAIAKL